MKSTQLNSFLLHPITLADAQSRSSTHDATRSRLLLVIKIHVYDAFVFSAGKAFLNDRSTRAACCGLRGTILTWNGGTSLTCQGAESVSIGRFYCRQLAGCWPEWGQGRKTYRIFNEIEAVDQASHRDPDVVFANLPTDTNSASCAFWVSIFSS